jgi:hypothetical protein
MQISKVEKRIKKIASFIEMFKADGKLSRIEKDLLLDYVRKLYDELSSLDDSEVQTKKSHKTKKEKVTPPKPESILPDSIAQKIELSTQKEEIVELKEEVIQTKVAVEIAPVVADKVDVKRDNGQINELFTFDEVKDMSDRLSLSKLSNINKAIGINEKIFTIKELFDGDAKIYKNTIEKLNDTKSMDEARAFLSSDIVEKYNWTSDEKMKKAHNFLKIVRRLYV